MVNEEGNMAEQLNIKDVRETGDGWQIDFPLNDGKVATLTVGDEDKIMTPGDVRAWATGLSYYDGRA
jgi:hypothetical protein